MKLYIAGQNQDLGIRVAKALKEAGHEITATWLAVPFNRTASHTEPERRNIADTDFNDIEAANALVLISDIFLCPGGKWVEAGIALGMKKPVFVLGHRENMLLWHPLCSSFASVEALVKWLRPPDAVSK